MEVVPNSNKCAGCERGVKVPLRVMLKLSAVYIIVAILGRKAGGNGKGNTQPDISLDALNSCWGKRCD